VLEVISAFISTECRRGAPAGRCAQGGFTLIELMVTFAVLAVMLTLAAPSFRAFQRNSELTSAANSLASALASGRAEAMKRQLNVLIRPTGGDWRNGWTVYADTDWDFAYTAGTDIEVVSQNALPASIAIASDSTPIDSTHYLMFSGAGFLRDKTGSFGSSRAVEMRNDINQRRFIIINPAGRMRVCDPDKETTSCTASDSF
jgi:type IV fimbrial biogenesis protein FimT